MLLSIENLENSIIWRHIAHYLTGIPIQSPNHITWLHVVRCAVHHLYGPSKYIASLSDADPMHLLYGPSNAKGDSPVVVLGVVLHAHNTPGSSSVHLPFARSNCFLIVWQMVLFNASACPLPWGYLGVEKFRKIFQCSQKAQSRPVEN